MASSWPLLGRPSPPPGNPVTSPYFPMVMGLRPPSQPPFGGRLMSVPLVANTSVVNRIPVRTDVTYNYSYGADRMPLKPPWPGGADGGVYRSTFQPYVRRLFAWAPSSRFMRLAFPRNYGISFRAPQISTQTTGGAGPGRMRPRPFFTRVQTIPRPGRQVPVYPTQSAGGAGVNNNG